MNSDNYVAARFYSFRLGRLRGFIAGNTLLNMVLLSLVFTCIWAAPALASGEAVVDEGDTVESAVAVTAVEEAVTVDTEAVEATDAQGEDAAADPEAVTETAPPSDNEAISVATGEEVAADDQAQTAVVEPEGAVAGIGEVPIDAEAAPPADEPCDCPEGQEALPTGEGCVDAAEFLELICGDAFWASIEDYNAGILSIPYTLTNTSSNTAVNNIRIVGATATNGVKVVEEVPIPLGSLQPGESLDFILTWQVPIAVRAYVTDISICADCEELCIDCDPEPPCVGAGCNPPVDEEVQPPQPPVDDAVVLHASVLPSTGLDMVTPLIFGLGLAMLAGLLPVARKAYRRIR
jgi:hypothetical protein